MGVLYIIGFRVLLYAVVLWLAISLFFRLRRLKSTPAPLQIGLEPVARGRWALIRWFGAMLFGAHPHLRMYPPALALGGLCLHLGILLALLGHLRFFLNPVPTWLFFLVPLARIGGCLLALGLLLLLMRRLADPRLWLLSKRADYGVLALLLAVALSGLALVHWAPPDPVAVKAVTLGLLRPWSAPGPWPGWLLASHIALVMALLAVFPFSKLMHGAQVFLNPILWQAAGFRAQGVLNPWDEQYLGDAPSREAVLPGEPQPWTRKDYREKLKNHWSGAGTKEVLSATQRAAAKPGGRQS
jgi:nitrate reductase gamma subunit